MLIEVGSETLCRKWHNVEKMKELFPDEERARFFPYHEEIVKDVHNMWWNPCDVGNSTSESTPSLRSMIAA